jgi:hypothetical protein
MSQSFFDSERARLTAEIAKVTLGYNRTLWLQFNIMFRAQGFEDLLSASNALNRTLEDGHGLSAELGNVAALWTAFGDLMRQSGDAAQRGEERVDGEGVPGTGGYVVRPADGRASSVARS